MKITIISYATFPSNTPRNLRTHELAKELSRQGNMVILYVLKGNYDYRDYEYETGIKVKSLGSTWFFRYDHKKGAQQNIIVKIIRKLIGKFIEFPFIELMFNSYRAIKSEKTTDLLITIAVPYPLHWGAALCRTISPSILKSTVWVADCGDPYMGNAFHKRPFYFKYIEKWFCDKADYLSIPVEEARNAYYQEYRDKIKVIPQGFCFDNVNLVKNYKKNNVPTFIYAGIFYNKLRDPRPFLDYLITLNLDFKFIIYTKTRDILFDYMDKLKGKLYVYDYIPRDQLIHEMSKVDFLINLENLGEVQSPSKLIDYALSNRPILSINTNTNFDKSLVDEFLKENYSRKLIIPNIQRYNIKNVANDFLSLVKQNS
ncbi:glycosyltransferase family 4 protein [Acinetobacter towneri]|uniref:glycosyltransferase family 4 protein n=1 Tax=Acinetobacter towneri TaxID=202956 RepID=UPI0014442FD0|nr:glycosyltransferase family 4 protein [Acinetobacter towneri]